MAILKYKNDSGNYVALTNYAVQPITPVLATGSSTVNIMSQAAVTDALSTKVDKVSGKSLVDDSAITKLNALPTNNELLNTTNTLQNNIDTLQAYVDELVNSNVDYYGVAWYDSATSPDLTRIGNMTMHKELPIQNMMRGYIVRKVNGEDKFFLLNDDWSALAYGITSSTDTELLEDDQFFVSIPEFWYFYSHDITTGYNKLLICEHAKAGWRHRELDYVSAYEGYIRDGVYVSIRDVVPTVSVTRTTIRSAVRSNGNDEEYNWNMYLYRQHRALCHLFMVEYATRNSLKAVNSTLTAEGFKQGGLGAGATTGTVTINGSTKYSYIPTGTSDALGNGSGMVTYTVTLSDSSGNETTAVTRYCSRYRGVENPFGHVWKYCDDVISKYSDGSRKWYMCTDPSKFSTSLNSSYKQFCASTCVSGGYKKTCRATEDCDFFAESVGGGGTTYWCDYNWDNTATDEHCLLVGGSANIGGQAGLFYLDSYDGVSYSSAAIGSRITYLPNA